MAQTMVPFNGSKLPAHIRKKSAATAAVYSGLDQMGGFPVLSIRGSKWRIKMSGKETPLLDAQKNPIPTLDVIILGSNKGLSKLYYGKAYTEGDDNPPDCFSMDGVRPDPSVAQPRAKQCATCPMNVFGSKITPQGTKTKACSDGKRLAVVLTMDLARDNPMIGPMLLRVPVNSLAKGEHSLKRAIQAIENAGADIQGVVTQLSFDVETDYPKINFKPVSVLNEEQYHRSVELAGSEVVDRITSQLEHAPMEPAEADDTDDTDVARPAKETKPDLDEQALADSFGADEDEEEEEDSGPTLGDEDEEEEEPAPPPARKKAPAKKAPAKKAPAKKAAPSPEDDEEDDEEGDDANSFDSVLGDIAAMLK